MVRLTEAEALEWKARTAEIARLHSRVVSTGSSSELEARIARLRIARAQIVKGAECKVNLAVQVLQTASALAETERDRGMEIEVLREVLALARDLGDAYQKAPPELKRHFLGLFFERFLVQDREIVEAVPTRLIKDLAACNQVKLSERGQVMVRGRWLPSSALFITLRDGSYMTRLRVHLNQIARFQHRGDGARI